MSSFNRATIKDDTLKYVGDVCTLIANPYQKSVSGKMHAPSSTSGASIFVAEGSGTVAARSETRSAVVVYDAEASLRKGQAAALVFERDSTDAVKAVKRINIGRPSTDFLSGGIISSTLTCSNTSSIDEIAGSQTQAVLYSVPKDVAALTATDVLQFTTDKENHLVSNISSKMDNTRTYGITEHNGARDALLRDKAVSNLAQIQFSVAASTAEADGFIGPSTTITATTTDFLTNAANSLFYSKRNGVDTKSPFSLASYTGRIELNVELKADGAAIASAILVVVAMDAAGGVLDSIDVILDSGADITSGSTFAAHIDANVESTTVPIDSIAVFLKSKSGSGNLQRTTGASSGVVTAIEETADIPGRPIHFAVFEGLNASASINIHAANIIAGTPDSQNAFISGGGATEAVFDYSMVNNMMLTFKHTFPRAYTGTGAAVADEALKEWFELEGMQTAMEAMAFRKIGRAFREIGRTAKQVRTVGSKIADVAKPVLTEGGMLLASGALGQRGQKVGAGMLAGAAAIEAGQRSGVLER